jgi:Na+/proline symporter
MKAIWQILVAVLLCALARTAHAAEVKNVDVRQLIEPSALTISFVVVFIVLSIGIGIYAGRKAKSAEQFFGGTKSFGPWVIALSSASAVMSAFGFIGGPGFVYGFGFSSIWMTFAAGTGFAYAYWILGKRMRGMAEVTNVATLPDIARIRFRSEAVRGLLALLLLIAAIAYLSAQVKGGAKLVTQMVGVSEDMAVIILFGTTLAYMTVSGMSGSILTDAFQGFVMILGVLGVLVGFFMLTGDNAFEVIQNAEGFGPRFVDGVGILPLHYVITFSVVFFVGVMGQPQMLTKMYSLKDVKGLKQAGFLSGVIYTLTSLVWLLVGYGAVYIVASGMAEPLTDKDQAAFLFLSKMSGVIQALVMAALLAAIMSTASFFVALASGAVTRDLLGSLGHDIPHQSQVRWGRILTVVVTISAVGFGYWGGDAVLVLGTLGWGFFVSGTLPAFLLGMLWRRTSKEGALAGLFAALAANIVLAVLDKAGTLKLPFPYYMLSISLSMALTIFVSLFTTTAAGDDLPKELEPIFRL